MPQSLAKNYIHIVFSTKYREPLLYSPVKEELYAYMGEICKSMECHPISIGGYTDHVHVLCVLSRKVALMKLVEEIKSHSSKWIKTKGEKLKEFCWQRGYGAFSVSQSHMEVLKIYIANQEQHHRKKDFQKEYRSILKKYQMEYDEKYVWD